MTTLYNEADGDLARWRAHLYRGRYGNQGRSWALNLRDSGLAPIVCVRRDETREQAVGDGFDAADLEAANEATIVCVLVPDYIIPSLPLTGRSDGCTIVASGYTLAFDRLQVAGDLGMVAPRMLGPEVRRCYEESVGFVTAVGVHRDVTGAAQARARRREGHRWVAAGCDRDERQEAILTSAVEQVLSPALTAVNNALVGTMLEEGIPIEAIITEPRPLR
jgi:ketol-acid reductoisomerase